MRKRKPTPRNRSSQRAARNAIAALSSSVKVRERMVSFGISCCLHVLLLLTLSLIAVGTGAVPDPRLLIAAPFDTEETATLTPEPDWLLEPDLPEAPTDNRPIEMAIVDLEASSAGLAKANIDSTPKEAELSEDDKSRRGSRSGNGDGNELQGMQALAAKGIQSRVSKAGGKKGEVQFALAWKNVNDLDLHVIAPSGEHISHQHRRSQCGGMLDVDMNVKGESEEPVENVRWLRNAPWGRYTILINFFRLNSEGVRRPQSENPYQLLAQLGRESEMRQAVAGFGERQVTVWRFQYVPASFTEKERAAMLEQLDELQAREERQAEPLLEEARSAQGPARQRMLQNIVRLYPHTDVAIEALQMIEGKVVKP